jgi:CheY-like chemotaxis protein
MSAEHTPSLLVVEDNRPNRILMETLLAGLGCAVTLAAGGAEALGAAAERRFDLILMDIEMPGMGGIETLARLRARSTFNAATPVVALTGHADDSRHRAFLAAGFVCVLVKPVSPRSLAGIISDCLRGRAVCGAAAS